MCVLRGLTPFFTVPILYCRFRTVTSVLIRTDKFQSNCSTSYLLEVPEHPLLVQFFFRVHNFFHYRFISFHDS